MNFLSVLLVASFLISCTSLSPKHKSDTSEKITKKSSRVKTKIAVEERSVCEGLKKWEASGWLKKCEDEMEGQEFDSSAIAICEKIAPHFDSPEEPLRCLNLIKSTGYNKSDYDDAALSVCDRLAQWEKTKFDAIWCLGVVKNKKYSEKTIQKSLKLAKPGKQPRKSLYMLDVEGTKF